MSIEIIQLNSIQWVFIKVQAPIQGGNINKPREKESQKIIIKTRTTTTLIKRENQTERRKTIGDRVECVVIQNKDIIVQ
jgi:hypothetical protein